MTIDEPFEYLTFGSTFSRTFGILVDCFDVFMALSAIAVIPYAILITTVSIVGVVFIIEEDQIPDFHFKHLPLILAVLTIQLIVHILFTIAGRGAIVRAVALMYIGQRPTWLSCLKEAWKHRGSLFCASSIICGALILAFILPFAFTTIAVTNPNVFTVTIAVLLDLVFIVAVVFGYIGTVMAYPAIVIENFKGLQGIQRSWDLSSGSRCYLLCALFCMWFVNNLVSRLLHNMFTTNDVMDVLFSIVGIVVEVLPMLLFFPLHTILETVMYLNLRIGRESMNHQILSTDLMNDAPQSARFRNDNPGLADESGLSMDYRHVPLMDNDEAQAPPTEGV